MNAVLLNHACVEASYLQAHLNWRDVEPCDWWLVADLVPVPVVPDDRPSGLVLRTAVALAPVPRRLAYVPGFGGHGPRSRRCRCSIADELICGFPHPDARESAAARDRRLQAALVVSLREARVSEWLADLYGTGAEREDDPKPAPYKRPSEAEEKEEPARGARDLSKEEERDALGWMRRQRLRGSLSSQRKEIAAQAWLELRRPPVRSVFRSFTHEVRCAWERAKRAIRAENETTWALPKPDRDAREKDRSQ